MRKRLIVAGLLIFLSLAPVYAGHSVAGGSWCNTPCCNGCAPDTGEECIPCLQSVNNSTVADTQPDITADSMPGFSPEVMLGLLMVLLVLRYRA